MAGLPSMVYGSGIRKSTQVQFRGYNHNLYAQDGELWDMENLTSDLSPLLSPRRPRWKVETLAKPNGLYAKDGLYWVDGTGFYADGVKRGTVTDSRKQFAGIGAYIILLPDKAYYNRLTQEFGSLESSWSGTAAFQDGTYAGEGGRGKHHLRRRSGLGKPVPGGGRCDHFRGVHPEQQSDHHHPGDRGRLPPVL